MFALPACATAKSDGELPPIAVYAPAELVEPPVPAPDSTVADADSPLSLPALLRYADAHSPAILTVRARVGLADAAVTEADIDFPDNPHLTMGVGGRTVDGDTGLELEVAVEQQFEIAGEQGLRRDVARAERQTSLARVNEVRWETHVQVHRLYVGMMLAAERRAHADRFVAFSTALKDIAARQVEAGQSAPLILLVAETDIAETREMQIEIAQLERSLAAELAAVIGWPTNAPPLLTGQLPPVRRAPPSATLLETMASHHPSVRTRELAVRAKRAQVALEEREGWPEPTLGVAYGREAPPGVEPAHDVWLLSLSLPLPLWRTNQAGQARARAEAAIADRERSQTAAQLRSQLLGAASELDAAADRVALYESTIVPNLEQSLKLLKRSYELGEVDVHQVSQTRERLLRATTQYMQARAAYYETAATLEGLIGAEVWSTQKESP